MASAGLEERGAIFTRREVVDFILDLVGYDVDLPLHTLRFLEPSFGCGDFLLPAIDRLLAAWKRAGTGAEVLENSLRAVELHQISFDSTCELVLQKLTEAGICPQSARNILNKWLIRGDFLLTPLPDEFDIVIGNPPYVRQELIPDILIAEYRTRYQTIYDRADIYIPFFERSLTLLAKGGKLGFICADRWMKNRYGGPLRAMIAESFSLSVYIDMTDTPAFHQEVVAYPAITVIDRSKGDRTRVAYRPLILSDSLSPLAKTLCSPSKPSPGSGVIELRAIASGAEPWILDSSDQLALVRRLEAQFPLIESVGCKIGIGVATGADKAFIAPFDTLDVEADRKLPLVMTRDIADGTVKWRGLGVINPFDDDGRLVRLDEFPRLRSYLEKHRDQIARRHVALKSPAGWYRTIDKIYPSLRNEPKLLIPDIKGAAHIVYEDGCLYPHHNLYFITSGEWELRALQAVLLSGIARLFVAIYSTKMRGGYLRFQAQYLRRIRLPRWNDVTLEMRQALKNAAEAGDVEVCNNLTFDLYGLSDEERAILGGAER